MAVDDFETERQLAVRLALRFQRLPETSANVMLGGDGNHVAAAIDVTASGELWNWADILEMTDISISLDAATAY